MPYDRYFIDAPLKEAATLSLEGDEAHHLFVVRGKVGETITLINGRNQLADALLQDVGKNRADCLVTKVENFPPPLPLILAQAIPRPNRLDTIIEKGTELGATIFWFFPGDQSEKKALSAKESERLKRIAIASIKQCGRTDLPEIIVKPPLHAWEKPSIKTFFGDTNSQAPWLKDVSIERQATLFIVGPESGFSERERRYLQAFALGVRLHSNILRTDTAGFVALALLG